MTTKIFVKLKCCSQITKSPDYLECYIITAVVHSMFIITNLFEGSVPAVYNKNKFMHNILYSNQCTENFFHK